MERLSPTELANSVFNCFASDHLDGSTRWCIDRRYCIINLNYLINQNELDLYLNIYLLWNIFNRKDNYYLEGQNYFGQWDSSQKGRVSIYFLMAILASKTNEQSGVCGDQGVRPMNNLVSAVIKGSDQWTIWCLRWSRGQTNEQTGVCGDQGVRPMNNLVSAVIKGSGDCTCDVISNIYRHSCLRNLLKPITFSMSTGNDGKNLLTLYYFFSQKSIN